MTINIFVLKGDLNGKIVVVRFFFCRVYDYIVRCSVVALVEDSYNRGGKFDLRGGVFFSPVK